ncbi:hypothetical protein MA16_Dca027488 [Dendrobium catenatum]|uniref:Uncharacterized protein n=1 Tax=Dendrobium catenatum TaxID=906689 RepID=A0A2I0VE52_9ASPA|nr:hypothetical protein MA16_Dca027488 [Dendrobium catenatum]
MLETNDGGSAFLQTNTSYLWITTVGISKNHRTTVGTSTCISYGDPYEVKQIQSNHPRFVKGWI